MPTAKEVFEKYILSGKRIRIKFSSQHSLRSFRSALNVYRFRSNETIKKARQKLIDIGGEAPDFVDCLDNKSICLDIISSQEDEIFVEFYADVKEIKQSFEIISIT